MPLNVSFQCVLSGGRKGTKGDIMMGSLLLDEGGSYILRVFLKVLILSSAYVHQNEYVCSH